jgi:hypothetical protein
MMEAVSSSGTSFSIYLTTWRNIPEDSHRHTFHSSPEPPTQFPLFISFQAIRTVAQAVSLWPPTAYARVCARISPCGVCGRQKGLGLGFLRFPSQFHSTMAVHIHIFLEDEQ